MDGYENKSGYIMEDPRSVKRSRSVLRILGIVVIFSSFMFIEIVLLQRYIGKKISVVIRIFLRGFMMKIIQGISLFITNWTLLENQKIAVNQHTETHIVIYIKNCKWIRIGVILLNSFGYVFNHLININRVAQQIFLSLLYHKTLLITFEALSMFGLMIVLPASYGAHIYMFYLLDHGITLLTADFMHLNNQLKRLRRMEEENLMDLISARELFSSMIRNTKNFEYFARYEAGRLYIVALISYILAIYEMVENNGKINQFNQLLYIVDCFTLMIFTYKAIKLNAICHQESETLYELSLPMRSDEYREEVILFYHRLTRNDIGFTFLGIFPITSNFVISLVTVAVSIILAVPSYLPLIKNT